ncbi:MAG: pseudouridine synthase, partial [Bacteroidota bacterium]
SGVLLFAKNASANSQYQQLFMHRQIQKTYLALVRGFAPTTGLIDYALKAGDKIQEAKTAYRLLQKYEISWPQGKFSSARYSLVELSPQTGRYHQLRKHMAHIFHPIIGDRPHGCNKQNRLWLEKIGLREMLLHASRLKVPQGKDDPLVIKAPMSKIFQKVLSLLEQKSLD